MNITDIRQGKTLNHLTFIRAYREIGAIPLRGHWLVQPGACCPLAAYMMHLGRERWGEEDGVYRESATHYFSDPFVFHFTRGCDGDKIRPATKSLHAGWHRFGHHIYRECITAYRKERWNVG